MLAGVTAAVSANHAGIIGGLPFGLSCTAKPEFLRVVVAPDIAPVVAAAIEDVNSGGSACDRVQLVVEESAVTAQKSLPQGLQVWIPSSSRWLDGADPDRRAYPIHDESLAHSPVILAVPGKVEATPWARSGFSWETLLANVTGKPVKVSMPDPSRDTVGLLSFLAVQAAVAAPGTDAGVAQLRALALRGRLYDASTSATTLLSRVSGRSQGAEAPGDLGVFPVLEQQLWRYQHDVGHAEVQSLYPTGITVEANYPVAVAAQSSATVAQRRLLTRFIGELRSVETSNALLAAGFRPNGYGGPSSLRSVPPGLPVRIAEPTAISLPDLDLRQAVTEWSRYQPKLFQVLVIIDRSGSMAAPVDVGRGRIETRASLLRSFGAVAAQTFTDDTDLGLWFFGTPAPGSSPTEAAVPVGPLTGVVGGESRRALFERKIATYTPAAKSETPLYKALLDATNYMRPKARPDRRTILVVLTDGRDDDSTYAIDKKSLIAQLRQGKPQVPVFSIGVGAGADMETLRSVAAATGGQAEAAQDPKDLASAMARIFLAVALAAK
ncbi:substrate-binding domain-containing protein [Micromonospora lupini]|uniref:substrate-binding domain-containing protein n=1 Tax=Micromonospora lupini TaxID=285679 RepID=UPI0031D40C05